MRSSTAVQNRPRVSIRVKLREMNIRALASAGQLRRSKAASALAQNTFVLTLHRIVPDDQMHLCRSPEGMVLRESLFVELLAYLKTNTTLLSPNDTSGYQRPTKLPKVLLTFDDGWLDNLTVAQPHLAAAEATACFFIPTRLTGEHQPFWPERLIGLIQQATLHGRLDRLHQGIHAISTAAQVTCMVFDDETDTESYLGFFKQLPQKTLAQALDTLTASLQLDTSSDPDPLERVMTWDQIRTMAQAGHKIGSHGCTHAILPLLPQTQSRMELVNSASDLEEQVPHFKGSKQWLSYPNGSTSDFLTCAASIQGYQYAFTNSAGRWSSTSPLHRLPRINIWDGTLTDQDGRFSKQHLEYSLYWKTRHADR
jgi:peptidoglycan/xylan/chitin deacetylase (PgdA/CDA1 family)